ncbi:MAG: prepilin-type N-terminal cleavage/methylation domain-containing protein, partial [Bacilli bacterium]|nr:prepilin-type N-terminal cleavage/methylation domain-containing protein [Bacilli bacterium]
MKNKGFTLIELLAVIVILAIIALIGTPIVLNIIEEAREESNERTVDMF